MHSRLTYRTVLLLLLLLYMSGCEGPEGPPGLDAEGFDTTPPTIKLTEPWPLTTVYDEFKVRASAVDNVAIEEVVFTVDGGYVFNGEILIDYADPYSFTIEAFDDVRLLSEGWHFVAARAYDTAGNYTDTPIVPINLNFTEDLHDTTLVQKFHNGLAAGNLTLPDSAETEYFWCRFNIPRSCLLNAVSIHAGGVFSDTSGISVSIWDGDIKPEDQEIDTLISNDAITHEPDWIRVELGELDYDVNKDFFVSVRFHNPAENDSLFLSFDDGLPFWNRSGSHDDDGFHMINERFGIKTNLMITCELLFPGQQAISGEETP